LRSTQPDGLVLHDDFNLIEGASWAIFAQPFLGSLFAKASFIDGVSQHFEVG